MYFHLTKTMLFLFLLMSIHEGMHVLCAYMLGYTIEGIWIYPFGLCALIKDLEYKDAWDEIKITLSGLSVHLIAAFFIPLLKYTSVSSFFVLYMQKANLSLLFFNCLPIYPLDGGRIVRNVLEYILPFKKAKYVSLLCSVICFIYFINVLPFNKIQRFMFFFLFVGEYIFLMIHHKEDVSSFYMYRLFMDSYKEIKIHTKKDVYKNKNNVYLYQGELRSEKDVLRTWI